MKKMRTLLKSFSFAALFAVAACGVDQADPSGSISKDDDTCLECRDPDADLERTPGYSQNQRDAATAGRATPARGAGPSPELPRDFCLDNEDCESNICVQEEYRCRDYP
jgi:hypothetical protein